MVLLEFIFEGFWRWLGCVIFFGVLAVGLGALLGAFRIRVKITR